MEAHKKWIINGRKKDYTCKIATINHLDCYLPSKNIHNTFMSMDMHDWANVFAITEANKVIMVRQHRLGADKITVEVPAGTLHPSEDPLEAAVRELEEETGYKPGNVILLKSILVNPAIQTNTCHFFLATDCVKTGNVTLDETEEIDIELYELSEILSARTTSLIENSVTLLSILLAKDYLREAGLYE